jgi:AcrR family transcriptional regulator
MALTETQITESDTRPSGARAAARRQAILDAALALLMDVGYDRMSMDALAERAHAGKATIYRHWSGKAEIVVEAVRSRKCDDSTAPPDTGSIRGDLLEALNHSRDSFTEEDSALLVGIVSAMHHDHELAALMRQQIFEAKQGLYDEIVARAVERGEPVSMRAAAVANEVSSALFFNRVAMRGGEIDEAFVLHMVDDVILPLLRC